MVDYEGITNGLVVEKVIDLMKRLGADRYEEKPDCVIFPTICHNEDAAGASMKLYYYKANHHFQCYTNCGNMTIFRFLQEYYRTRQMAYDWFDDIVNVAKSCSSYDDTTSITRRVGFPTQPINKEKYKKRPDVKLPTYPESVLDVFDRYYPVEWLRDGISKAAMDKYNIRFSPTQNKIIIPHYDMDGELVGIRGRALNSSEIEKFGKYKPVRIEDTLYRHSTSANLYGLNFNAANIRENGYVFVFEAEKSVLQCDSWKRPNCAIAVCGSNFNKYQLNILMKTCAPREIVICFDKEEKPGEDKYFNKLMGICRRYINYADFSFIYDVEGLLGPKDSPSDRGEEIFNRLLEKRIHVQ